MGELKYVTDQELIDKYKAEASRKAWFGDSEWVFTPNVDPDKLILLSYDSVPDIYGILQDEQTWAKNDAFVAFVGTPEGPSGGVRQSDLRCIAHCFRQANDQLYHEDVRVREDPRERIPPDLR